MSASGLSTLKQYWIPERGARMARRDDREYREYLREEQRRQPGCPAREPVLLQRRQATRYVTLALQARQHSRYVSTLGTSALQHFSTVQVPPVRRCGPDMRTVRTHRTCRTRLGP